jgi:hypothetical protein
MPFDLKIDPRRAGAHFDAAAAFHRARIQTAMLAATRKGADRLETKLRAKMRDAGLGSLGQAIKASSDEKNGGGVHSLGGGGFSAWGLVSVRSRSERTRGTIEAYVQGADIRPRRGRFLWIPSDEIQRYVGGRKNRQRVTPGTWASSGMEAKLGPLKPIKSVNGRPLLVVESVGTSLAGARRSAKSLTKSGRARKGQRIRTILVAFIGIPATSRAARIDVDAIHREVLADLPQIFANEMRKAGA